ncbi:MAG: restriction endonuclease subunit S, partial [Enterococcus hirae]|nr:restriction endonuclease subunit S [Enterococcus hirae]
GIRNSSARWVKKHSILIALAGQGKTRGMVAVNNIPLTTNQSVAAIEPDKTLNYEFVFQNLSKRYDELRLISSGDGSRGGLNKQIVSDISIACPNVNEQELIGNFLADFDSLITMNQHKLDKLKNLKKAYLSEMFPAEGKRVPKRRFPGFEGEWERQKWMDTVNISTEMVDPSSGEFDNMLHIAPGNIESFTGRILDNIKTVKEEHLISGKFRFRAGDIVYGKINPQLGKYFFAKIDGLTSADAYVLNGINGTKQEFLYTILQSKDFFNYSVSVSKRSGMPKINREELNDYSYWRPGEDEQNKIGELFQIIDTLQSLQQQKLDKLNDLKKAYLNELFV